jgi:hypothetical protein
VVGEAEVIEQMDAEFFRKNPDIEVLEENVEYRYGIGTRIKDKTTGIEYVIPQTATYERLES